MNLSNFNFQKGVYIISPINTNFSDAYIDARKKENRVLTDVQVSQLPNVFIKNLNYKEWKLREKTANRFFKYIRKIKNDISILDVGCGNGWFSNKLANFNNISVLGLDVNMVELVQASRVFNKQNLQFIYYDIFTKNDSFQEKFDIITLNASAQYFPKFKELIKTLSHFLKQGGEIHILDTPFYLSKELENAKKRTHDYYNKLSCLDMANLYYHHNINELINFDVLYKPNQSIIRKILFKKDSPFSWFRLKQ